MLSLFYVRLATTALCELDNLAEHFILYSTPGIDWDGVKAERKSISAQEPMVGLAKDVHDTHKHGRLIRKSAKITQGQRPQLGEWGLGINALPINAGPIGGGMFRLLVTLDDGTAYPAELVISGDRLHWVDKLDRAGI
jgi:hypothetical protein